MCNKRSDLSWINRTTAEELFKAIAFVAAVCGLINKFGGLKSPCSITGKFCGGVCLTKFTLGSIPPADFALNPHYKTVRTSSDFRLPTSLTQYG
jgi:hypothetical protein